MYYREFPKCRVLVWALFANAAHLSTLFAPKDLLEILGQAPSRTGAASNRSILS